MATIATIAVNLEAGTASFVRDIEKSGEKVTALGKIIENTRGIAEHFAEGLGIASGVEAFETAKEVFKRGIEEIKRGFEDVSRIGHDALKLGVSAEQMSQFQHAANATHTDIAALTTGMDHLNRQIGLVASGDKSAAAAANAFNKLHIDMQNLAASSPDAAFKQIAAALQTVHSTFERAAITQEIFGRGGRELIPVMAHLQDLMKESDDIGFTRTAENIEKAEAMEREMARTTDTIKGAFMDLATSDFAAHIISGIEKVTAATKQFVGDSPALAIEKSYESVHKQIEKIAAEQKSIGNNVAARIDSEQRIVALLKEQFEIGKRAAATQLTIKDLKAHDAGDDRAIIGLAKSRAGMFDAMRQIEAHQKDLDVLLQTKSAQAAIAAEMQKSADRQATFAQSYQESMKGITNIRAALQKKIDDNGLTDGMKSLRDAMQDVIDKRAMFQHANMPYSEAERAADDAMIEAIRKKSQQLDSLKTHAESARKAMESLSHLKEQFDSIGKNSSQRLLSEIEKSDLSPAMKSTAEQWQKAIDAAQAHNKEIEEAHSLLERLATPAQKYAAELEKINQYLKDGLITQQQAKDAKEAAANKLHEGNDTNQLAGAMVRRFDFHVPTNSLETYLANQPKLDAAGKPPKPGTAHNDGKGLAGINAHVSGPTAAGQSDKPADRTAKAAEDLLEVMRSVQRQVDLIENKVVNNFGGVDTSPQVFDIP